MLRVTLANPMTSPSSLRIASRTASAQIADAPAFALEPAFGCGYAEGHLRECLILILAREEDSERAANDLVCEISLQALGARVVTEDVPSRSIV
jgi:hypothetical protein